tara:strand:- start:52 stop:312 length:261 start_codon:yes stop_codon:yes gene_type:complete
MDKQKEDSLRQCIAYCIENNDVNNATQKIIAYIKDELEDQFNEIEQVILSDIRLKHQKQIDDEVKRHLLGNSSNGELKGFFNLLDA